MEGLFYARPPAPKLLYRGVAGIAAVLSLLVCGGVLTPAPVAAQELTFPQL